MHADPSPDPALLHAAICGYGSMLRILAEAGHDDRVPARAPLVGAHLPGLAGHPWFDAAVLPPGRTAPDPHPSDPACIWTDGAAVAGRRHGDDLDMPCLGRRIDDAGAPDPLPDGLREALPPLSRVGELNEDAYGEHGWFAPMLAKVRDPRLLATGAWAGDDLVAVAVGIRTGDDLGIHFAATVPAWRRRGIAGALVAGLLRRGRALGCRTATLQSSPDGLGTWTRLGFRPVGRMSGWIRPPA